MITTINNLSLIAAERIQADLKILLDEYELYDQGMRLDAIDPIEDIAKSLESVYGIFNTTPGIDQIIVDLHPYFHADITKIIEYCDKFRDQVNKDDTLRAESRLRYMINKADRLVKRHTYLKEQVLI